MAGWYSRMPGPETQLAGYREQAAGFVDGLPDGAHVLEVAPGPGYLAIEIARLGRQRVTGLDISRTSVEIANDHARRLGVSANFRHGDVAEMTFASNSFDLVICQAAFKNFTRPVRALDEMHRVLRRGGVAVIQDMSHDGTGDDINREVRRMALGRMGTLMTGLTLRGLRRRALSAEQLRRYVAESAFGTGDVRADGITLEARLTKV